MPDPALSSGRKCLISGMPDTKEEYCSISQNQIMCPSGHAPCGRVYFKDREKLNVSFLRSFFVLMESAVSFFWLYRKVKKGKLYGRSKNQNPVRRAGSLDGGYGRRVSELLPPMVAAEETGAEEPGGNGGTRVYGRIV